MTIDRRAAAGAALALALALVAPRSLPAEPAPFDVVYVQRAGDPFYAPHRAYTGLTLRDRHRPGDGVRVAIAEGRILARALGVSVRLVEHTLEAGESAATYVEGLVRKGDARVFVLDLPIEETLAAARAVPAGAALLFNVRHLDDRLRGADCAPSLLHTIPSQAMLMDGLAQLLRRRDWREVLVLVGPEADDVALAAAFRRSARKFGVQVVAERPFVLRKDPRQRDRNNVALLTGGIGHDVVFVADTVGEFGRYVPYATQRPRPVIGSAGLRASAWHWAWERHGAPQLNQRFDRAANRQMQQMDYAGWLAGKALLEAMVRTRSREPATLRSYLVSDELRLDTYTGAPGSFRPWDGQLRQSILLATHDAVIERAPFEEFLHQRNVLDTLGADERETTCRQ